MCRLVAIVGPTGIGKSRLALHLAQVFNGEIVSADSRQVYRYMDIGTAKPEPAALALVPHHLIDIINPDENFNLTRYQALANQAINSIRQCDKLPFLVGGTGQYVWALLEGWKAPQVPPDPEFRHNLEEMAAHTGPDALYQQLEKIDPDAAKSIDPRNVRRVIRALEEYQKTNIPFSQLKHKESPLFNTLIIGITAERAELHRRIDQRVDEMVKQGLVAEVKRLLDMGYDFTLPAMSGIGYKQIGMFLRSEFTLDGATQQIKFESHRFARRQYTWFRLKDERIRWFDIQRQSDSEIEAILAKFIKSV